MASLKTLRTRIKSVRSTQKITAAMKMVAAAKLRHAQSNSEAARPYAEKIQQVLQKISASSGVEHLVAEHKKLLLGTGQDKMHLLVAITADSGLCGAFNSNVNRAVRDAALQLTKEGKNFEIFAIGLKGQEHLENRFPGRLIGRAPLGKTGRTEFANIEAVAGQIIELFDKGGFDVCRIFSTQFISVISQKVTDRQLIPLTSGSFLPGKKGAALADEGSALSAKNETAPQVSYEFEPDESVTLERLLPHNVAVQLYSTVLESITAEFGARMTAMDSASRNASKMIQRLSLKYNRTRQANITSELIEIISGAEAL